MPKREETLRLLFRNAGYYVGKGQLSRPSMRNFGTWPGHISTTAIQVYKSLGGVLDSIPLRPGAWDMEITGVAVELDEEQHFNRFRLATLESPYYREQKTFPVEKYREFCSNHEEDCIRKAANRGYWSNESTVKQFGTADSLGQLSPVGSPRWKQRAFYDYLKDLAPVTIGIPVARIAIWDTIGVDGREMEVKEVLDHAVKESVPGLIRLIQERSGASMAV